MIMIIIMIMIPDMKDVNVALYIYIYIYIYYKYGLSNKPGLLVNSKFLMDAPLIYKKSFFCTSIILECLLHSRMLFEVTWNKFLSFS